jgi:hypothetical protein
MRDHLAITPFMASANALARASAIILLLNEIVALPSLFSLTRTFSPLTASQAVSVPAGFEEAAIAGTARTIARVRKAAAIRPLTRGTLQATECRALQIQQENPECSRIAA